MKNLKLGLFSLLARNGLAPTAFAFVVLSILSFSIVPDSLDDRFPSIKNILVLTELGSGFTAPDWCPGTEGEKLISTKKGFKGLYYHDIVDCKTDMLTDAHSAGYKYQFLNNDLLVTKFSNLHNSEDVGFRRTEGINIFSLSDKKSVFKKEFQTSRLSISNSYMKANELKLPLVIDDKVEDAKLALPKDFTLKSKSGFFNSNLVYYSDGIIISMDGEDRQITDLYGFDPVVSPDGKWLCYNDMGMLKIIDQDFEILKVGYGVNAVWTPDSAHLVFQRSDDDGVSVTASDLYTYKIIDNETTQLTNTPDILEEYPAISEDGGKIVYTDMEKGNIYIGKITF